MLRVIVLMMLAVPLTAAEQPVTVVDGLKHAEAVCFGAGGKLFAIDSGRKQLLVIENGKATVVAGGFDRPAGMVYYKFQKSLLVVDGKRILKVNDKFAVSDLIAADKFPEEFAVIYGVAIDEFSHSLLVCGLVTKVGEPAIYKIDLKKSAVTPVKADAKLIGNELRAITFDGSEACIVSGRTRTFRLRLSDQQMTPLPLLKPVLCSFSWDNFGRLYYRGADGIYGIPRPGAKPVRLNAASVSNLCVSPDGAFLMLAYATGVSSLSTKIPGWEVDVKPLPVSMMPAFPKLKWTGWDDGSENGKVINHRPIVLTHAGDGSNRIFVALQQGTIHIIEGGENATATKVFLDITKKVKFAEKQNEEGLLGVAFHPDYKSNGEFFVFYTDANAKMTNVVSRFKVKKDNRDEADTASEEVILKIEKPYWNHDGGTIAFGPDGYLYITHGDGGLGNDPHGNGQSLKTLLGKILRIDVNKKADGRNYAIPADNPFAKQTDAKPEIYAYGLRNVWRFAFDHQTKHLWAADVGQNVFEEINLIKPGMNYGWSVREGLHPFGKAGQDASEAVAEPIWEYHHEIGKSITGGHVYRGKAIPELNGLYLYADYVTPNVWALRYDDAKGRVTGNHPLGVPTIAVMSFGEDQAGESYILGATPNGKGILKFVKK